MTRKPNGKQVVPGSIGGINIEEFFCCVCNTALPGADSYECGHREKFDVCWDCVDTVMGNSGEDECWKFQHQWRGYEPGD